VLSTVVVFDTGTFSVSSQGKLASTYVQVTAYNVFCLPELPTKRQLLPPLQQPKSPLNWWI
jgi:hypothetical protein